MIIKEIEDISFGVLLDSNDKLIKGEYSRNSYADFNLKSTFNNKGLIVVEQKIYFNPDRIITSKYYYDSNFNEIKSTSSNSDNTIDLINDKIFNKNNKLENWIHISNNNQSKTERKYKYDSQSKLVRIDEYENGKLLNYETVTHINDREIRNYYNSINELLWQETKTKNYVETNYFKNNEIETSTKITYKNKLRVRYEYKKYAQNDNYYKKIIYSYNNFGDVSLEKIYVNGKQDQTIKYLYKYDDCKNYIERIQYFDNHPKYIVTRKITYH
ncbi:hypothetical protein [Flavobacterium sp. LC2016-12]|uniref:hypothetical protein n=1 Tax=Flavobacterium sp. LC2016-12 TaxID=2783794 RepID=UPI00188D70DA|nr:hypothetical protein [Flavobacterium sp. LC2016-12]MBF4466174.1 hypothetical protein [Flavobacterium sp. LC2016-12]